MKDYQSDKYENFFLHLRASREAVVKFADFTATAVTAPGIDALIAGHGAPLAEAVAAFRTELVTQKGQGGSSQSSTSAEQTAFDTFKAFIQATDKKVLSPYLYDHPDELAAFYPDKLSGLTQAPVKHRLTRLTAYTEILEGSPDQTVQAQGAPARLLLKAYIKASTAKTKARTAAQDTLGDLGPAAQAVAEALWDVHIAALYAHRHTPGQARKYFDYASLPNRTGPTRKTAAAPKV